MVPFFFLNKFSIIYSLLKNYDKINCYYRRGNPCGCPRASNARPYKIYNICFSTKGMTK